MKPRNPKGRPPGIIEMKPRRPRKRVIDQNRLFLTPAEVAKMTGLGLNKIRASYKELGARRHGIRVLIPTKAIEAWVASLPEA
jgi:hypothetical protein